MMKEKLSVVLGVGLICLVSVMTSLYFIGIEIFEFPEILMIAATVILIAGTLFLLRDRLRNIRLGLPSADERVKKLHWKAGAYTYYATIWIAVGTLWYNIIFADNLGYPELTAGQTVGVIVLLSGILWFALQLYLMRKGDA